MVNTFSLIFWSWNMWGFLFCFSVCISPQPHSSVTVEKSPDYEDSVIITIPRGSVHEVTCGSHTENSTSSGNKNDTKSDSKAIETVQILQASYLEASASVSKPATFTVPACQDHAELRKSLLRSCNMDTATSCVFDANNSLDSAECRWQYLAITYQCAAPPESELSPITTMVGQDIILDAD